MRTFKRLFYTFVAGLALVAAPVYAQIHSSESSRLLDIKSMNVKELTNGENFRYARELYRKGDFAESAKVFQRILKTDCTNRLAQYHLQKISRKAPEFAELQNWLTALPCEKYNFADEDFLPASLYYEKDNDLLLEQLAAYNKRYRDSKTTLSAKIAEYAATAARLEEQIKAMTDTLNSEKQISVAAINELSGNLDLAKKETLSMNDQINELKNALTQAKAEMKSAPGNPSGPANSTNATELNTLQEKFANILTRLQLIETTIANRNQNIKAIQ